MDIGHCKWIGHFKSDFRPLSLSLRLDSAISFLFFISPSLFDIFTKIAAIRHAHYCIQLCGIRKWQQCMNRDYWLLLLVRLCVCVCGFNLFECFRMNWKYTSTRTHTHNIPTSTQSAYFFLSMFFFFFTCLQVLYFRILLFFNNNKINIKKVKENIDQ